MTGDLRRSQLLQSAIRVFARNGFKGTRTREIADEAGVNEALLFRHFPTKDDLYQAILEDKAGHGGLNSIIVALDQHAEKRDDEAYFQTLASRFLECLSKDPEFMRLMLFSALEQHELARLFRERHVKPLHQVVGRYIAARQREGAFRCLRPAVAVRALFGMMAHHVLATEIFGDRQPTISNREAVSAFTSIFLAGMRAKEGG